MEDNLRALCEELWREGRGRRIDDELLECLALNLKLTEYSHLCLFALLGLARDNSNCRDMLHRNLQAMLIHEFNYTFKFTP